MKTLDWKNLAETCPKGFEMWQIYYSDNVLVPRCGEGGYVQHENLDIHIPFNDIIGHLFEFFDAKGIYIEICRMHLGLWTWNYSDLSAKAPGAYNTRNEAHIAAFERSFTILETQLNKD